MTIKLDQISDALTSVPGVSVDLIDATSTGSPSTTSSTFVDISSDFTNYVYIPISGKYRILITVAVFSSGASSSARFALLEDDIAVTADTAKYDVHMQNSSGQQETRTFVFDRELTAGNHTYKFQWRRSLVQGGGTVSLNTDSHLQATAELLSGSGAGGVLVSRKTKSTNQTGIAQNTWTVISELDHNFRVNSDEDFELSYMAIATASAAATIALGYRIDSGAWIPLEGETNTADWWTPLSGTKLITGLAAGSHLIEFGLFQDGSGTGTVFGDTSFGSITWSSRSAVTKYRGGLVPIQLDGYDVVGQPRGLNFVGSGIEVTDNYGIVDISLPEAVTAAGEIVQMMQDTPTTSRSTSSGTFSDIDAELEEEFTISGAGTYLVFLKGQVEATAGADASYRLVFDSSDFNGYSEQIIAPANWVVSAPVSSRETFTLITQVTLTDNGSTHRVKPQWAHAGSGQIQSDAADNYVIEAIKVSGSGAGGVLIDAKIDSNDYTVSDTTTYRIISDLTTTFNVSEDESVACDGQIHVFRNGGSACTVDAFYRIDSGSWFPLQRVGISPNLNVKPIAFAFTLEDLAEGSHTVEISYKKNDQAGTEVRAEGSSQGVPFRLNVRRFRGGLVPIRSNGVTKVDKPAALNFIGADVQNSGGTANISLPAAVTVPGDAAQIISLVPASAIDYSSGTFSNVSNGSDNAETTFEAKVSGQYIFHISTQLNQNGGSFTGVAFRLVIDQSGFGGFTEQIAAPDSDTAWSILIVGAGDHDAGAFTTQPVTLEAGTHQVNVQYRVLSGSGARMNTDDYITVTALAVTGSGAGGILVEEDTMSSSWSPSVADTWEKIDNGGGDVAEVTFDTSEDEWVMIVWSSVAENTAAHESGIRLNVDSVIYQQWTEDSTVAAGGNAKNLINQSQMIQLSSGSHTAYLEGFSSSTATSFSSQTRIEVLRFRGGLVPIRSDGYTVLDKPAALDFGAGLDVTIAGGVATIDVLGAADIIRLPEQMSDPTASADDGYLYTKDVGGLTELFYLDSNASVTQLTSDGHGYLPIQDDGYEVIVNPSALNFGRNLIVTNNAGIADIDMSEVVALPVQISDPTASAIDGYLYTKDIDSYNELHYIDNYGTISQITSNGNPLLKSYTVSSTPPSGIAGEMIFVTDEVGGAVPAFWDGSDWRRVTDRAIITT